MLKGSTAALARTRGVVLLDERDVDRLASVEVALAAARRAAELVAAGSVVTGRLQVDGPISWMRILAGMVSDLDLLGYKEFHRVGKEVRYHVHLFRGSTGEPLGIVDGRRITSLRTAATAALAARHCCGQTDVRLAVIGSGEEAREGLRALDGALRLREVAVYSPTPQNRAAFAAKMSDELGIAVVDRGSLAECLDGAEAAFVASSSRDMPFVTSDYACRLRILLAVGSTRPEHRELCGEVFASAGDVVIDTHDALHEAGDLIEAVQQGAFDERAPILLADYLQRPARARDAGPTVFKSIGSVEQDLVLAHTLVGLAGEQGVGRAIDTVASIRVMR